MPIDASKYGSDYFTGRHRVTIKAKIVCRTHQDWLAVKSTPEAHGGLAGRGSFIAGSQEDRL